MSEQNQDQANETKLYAGKFKTVEELEAGYKNSLPLYQENEQLKTNLKQATEIPVGYLNPEGITLDAGYVSEIQARAKEAGLTQKQYEKALQFEQGRISQRQQDFEGKRKSLGEENLNVIQDYVKKNYPEEIHEAMINTFIADEKARNAALNHRSQLLNTNVPGINRPSQPRYTITDKDVEKAYKEKEQAQGKHKLEAQQRYLNLMEARAQQRNAG